MKDSRLSLARHRRLVCENRQRTGAGDLEWVDRLQFLGHFLVLLNSGRIETVFVALKIILSSCPPLCSLLLVLNNTRISSTAITLFFFRPILANASY